MEKCITLTADEAGKSGFIEIESAKLPEEYQIARVVTDIQGFRWKDIYEYPYLEPEELKTPELCLAAVQIRGDALEYVPDELKTIDLCLTAVAQNEDAIEHVPYRFKDGVKALNNNHNAVRAAQVTPGFLPERMGVEFIFLI